MLDKKQKELKSLKLIYDLDDFVIVNEKSEKPDFILKQKGANVYFGVEVTEFYRSDSNARLLNMSGYLDRLVKGESPIKKDKKVLKVDELIFQSQDGSTRRIKGVLQIKEPVTFYTKKIEEIIKEKSEKLKTYNNEVTHINLIIHDKENYISEIEMGNFYPTFFNEKIIKQILESDFNEIFLITSVSSGSYFFPLKSIFFAEKFQLFVNFLKEKGVEFFSDIKANIIEFCRYLSLLGAKEIVAFENKNIYALAYGNMLLQISSSDDVGYRLIPLKDIKLTEIMRPFFNDQIVCNFYNEFNEYSSNFFTSGSNYGFKVISLE